jgi:M6 family metalloprotease-like protein
MNPKVSAAAVVLVSTVLLAGHAGSMPPHPDLLERLRTEERTEDFTEIPLLGRLGGEAPEVRAAPTGSIRILVLLADFSDVPADTIQHSLDSYREMLFSLDNPHSMRNYYLWSSYGRLDMTGEIFGWFRLPLALSYYANDRRGMAGYPQNAQRMVEHAVIIADTTVDFSAFDNDGPDGIPNSGDDDGLVDYLMVIHAGQGWEWTMNDGDIHSHAGNMHPQWVDGVEVKPYATEPEDGQVGTFAHELGHLLGLPDLYDITLNTYGLGMWSLMSYGSWGGGDGSRPVGLDAWSRAKLGFLEPTVMDSNHVGYGLPCVEDEPHVLKAWSEAEEGPQYFLIENRVAKSWDSYLSEFGEGLLVYHIDERAVGNSSEGRHLVSLEQADGNFDLEQRRIFGYGSDGGDPYPGVSGNRTFTWWSVPSNHSNENQPTQVSLRNISDPGATMTFDIEVWSPIILLETYVADDAAGDGDGRPEPGEDITLKVKLRNHGVSCEDVHLTLETSDPHIEPARSEAVVGLIPRTTVTGFVDFPASISEDILEPYEVSFNLTVQGSHAHGDYSSSDMFLLAVPLRVIGGWPHKVDDALVAAPVAADLDRDGLKEIIAGCADGLVYVWSSDGALVEGWPRSVGSAVTSKPAVCDVDLDSRQEVVVAASGGQVCIYNDDGSVCSGWPQAAGGALSGTPLLADIDDDGLVEVICACRDGKVYAWNEDGSRADGWPVRLSYDEIWMSPGAADIDGDFLADVIVGVYGGELYAIGGNGKVIDGWPVPIGRGCGRGAPCMADFDGDGSLDIAVSGLFSNSIYVLGRDGKIKGGWPRWSYNCDELSSPVPADIDNDGLAEVAVTTSCGTIVAWNANGSLCQAVKADAPDPVQYCEPVFADLDGNGSIEGVFGTTSQTQNQVYGFGGTGRVVGFPIDVDGHVWGTPFISDLEGDGHAEIIAVTTAGTIHVWRFIGAKPTGRVEYSQARGDLWNTGQYGFVPRDNVPLPDLAVLSSDISVNPDRPRQGERAEVRVRVYNAGHAVAEDFTVSAYYDAVSASHLIGSVTVGSLGAKTDTTVVFAWTVPGGVSNRLIYGRVDEDDLLLERVELNNQASKRLYLALADLKIKVTGVEPFPIVVGESLSVHAILKNVGEDIARNFSIVFCDSLMNPSRIFSAFDIDSLVPGDSLEFLTRHKIDAFKDDYVMLWAQADPSGAVVEYYRSNNAMGFTVESGIKGSILRPPHEIHVTDIRSSRNHLIAESPACNCVFATSVTWPFGITFQTNGSGIDLSRNTVVFGSEGDIAGYDLADSLFFVVSSDEEYETQPTVWGRNTAWISEAAESTSLRLRRASEKKVETVRSVRSGMMADPDMSGFIIAWEEDSGYGSDIMAYDLNGDSVFVVAREAGDQVNPAVWGQVVVWEDRSSDQGDIMAMDCRSGQRITIAVEEGSQRNPDIEGDIVVWQDSRSGNWDILGYSLATQEAFPICRQVDDQISPCLNDSTVFWIDRRRPTDIVRGLRFGGNRRVATVRNFETLWQDGQIRVIANVVQHDDDLSYRIYRYPDNRPMTDDRFTHVRHEFGLGMDSVYVFVDTLVAARRSFFYTLGIIDAYGEEDFHGPVEGRAYHQSPTGFVVGIPQPNPFRNSISIVLGLPRLVSRGPGASWPDPEAETSHIEMSVYSVSGRLVRTIERGEYAPGYYRFVWDGRNNAGEPVSAGVYFMTATAGSFVTSKKIVLVK